MKEQQPIGITELQRKIDRFNGALGKANRVSQTIGTPEFGRPELDISPSSQLNGDAYLDAAIKVGNVRKALTENAIPKITDLKDQTQRKIDGLEPKEQKIQKPEEIRELVRLGYLPDLVLARSQEILQTQSTQPAQQEIVASQKDISIDELNLQVKFRNILSRAGIRTIDQLLHSSREDLLRLRNMGAKTLEAIEEKLMEKGIALAKEDESLPDTEAKRIIFPKPRLLTNVFAERVRQQFTGRLPNDTQLLALYLHKRHKGYSFQAKANAIGIRPVVGWDDYLCTLERKKMGIIGALGRAIRVNIETVGDIRQSDVETLMRTPYHLQPATANFLIHAFKDTTIAADKDKGLSLAVGKPAETLPKEAEILTPGRQAPSDPSLDSNQKPEKSLLLITVEEALGIDIATYLEEEYQIKQRSVRDIARDITDKTNGETRIQPNNIYYWLKKFRIDTRDVSESVKLSMLERERHILEERDKGKSLEKIGAELGIHRERVRQIEFKARLKLRRQLNSLASQGETLQG